METPKKVNTDDFWIADAIATVIFAIVMLSMMIEWDVVFNWFKGE